MFASDRLAVKVKAESVEREVPRQSREGCAFDGRVVKVPPIEIDRRQLEMPDCSRERVVPDPIQHKHRLAHPGRG